MGNRIWAPTHGLHSMKPFSPLCPMKKWRLCWSVCAVSTAKQRCKALGPLSGMWRMPFEEFMVNQLFFLNKCQKRSLYSGLFCFSFFLTVGGFRVTNVILSPLKGQFVSCFEVLFCFKFGLTERSEW